MKYCSNCGKELVDGANFCGNCGKAVSANNATAQRKTAYEGEVRKCPQCGEVINAFVPVCPTCGHEMRGASATSVVHDLAMKLDKTRSVSEKEKLIRNFYIPNTREDIIECLILASSNIETNSDCSDAWAAKLEQIYQKAKLTFGSSTEFEYVEAIYNKTLKNFRRHKSISTVKNASGGVFHGAGTVINGIWNLLSLVFRCIGKILAFFGNIITSLVTSGALKTIVVAFFLAIVLLALIYNS